MTHEPTGPLLAAVFVDYDNIYLSLRRKNEEAAKRFSRDAGFWIKQIASGVLMTSTNGMPVERQRRLVMTRCYGNPVPRRNTNDNSTDMNSFPFIRHHFLRGGFEVVDCPPLTAQLKNSADIRMVMDMRDLINHEAYYEEFIILSSDADFTPMLHRLRSHARRTVVYANDYTAAPYTAICDAEIRESDLIKLLLDGRLDKDGTSTEEIPAGSSASNDQIRSEIIAAVISAIKSADAPVPLEALAERTTRALGHDQTVATGWAGAGSFLELLRNGLPDDIRLTDQPPYLAFDARRAIESAKAQALRADSEVRREPEHAEGPRPAPAPAPAPVAHEAPIHAEAAIVQRTAGTLELEKPVAHAPEVNEDPANIPLDSRSEALQSFISRIHEASQVPVLSPSDYRKLFVVMADEINQNNLRGAQTITNIVQRAADRNVEVRNYDVRFILEVVGEADPWFEQGASANLFAGRFHNFVVARCRSEGLKLSLDDLDLIEAWFAGNGEPLIAPTSAAGGSQPAGTEPVGKQPAIGTGTPLTDDDDFPRILQSRHRG